MRCKSGNLGLDEELGHFDSVIQMKPIPSIWALDHLLGALSKMNQCSTVVSMYKQMLACVGLHPEVSTLSVVINCLCRMNRVDLGFSVLATILKHGLQPNALLHGICKYRSLSEAMELLRKIEEKGLACSEITYATIINGLCRDGKTCMALEILEQMYEDGRFKPVPQCYNPIIDSLCKEKRIDEAALTLFRDMINKSVAPNIINYSSLIYGLCNMDLWTRALALFEIMKNKGIKPDVFTFNSLIGASCKSGKLEEAVLLFRNMIDCGALPNVVTFNSMLDALCKEGKTAEAVKLMEEVFLRGVKPDLVTYNSLINILCRSAQWKEATRLFNRMLDEGIAPNVVTFNTVIHALCKERRTEEALSVLELMSQRGMRLEIFTYNSLIYGICRTDQWAEATRVFDEMVVQGVLPDIITLITLLNALFRGMPEEAHKVVEAKVKYGMELSKITCSMLIDDYCFRGKMDKAKKVIDLMVIKDNVPDIASCYKALVNGYMQAKRIG
ncbi:pentatricopeptide repeat-containing protein At1g63130, mitochondrial-like [Prunus avium]|uniref:Pentatricopeptide repeat-containing protein At1g63130, mitochondrial-like n=1 Tax=Prunus avium TaxID=42229 RepID=A0A6P5SB04_PRUAV|nr:pentatricopeptide repeat-containing protein At1g63130, mitochondrial-like [Prunus avium]